MKYERNYLTRVIFQTTLSPILALETGTPSEFQNRIKERFPLLKEGREIQIETKFSQDGNVKTEAKVQRSRWIFWSQDGAKTVTIAANLFSLEYTKYSCSDDMKDDFAFAWAAFRSLYGVEVVERVGLRYINEITLPTGEPFKWDEYIDNNLIRATLGFGQPEQHKLARSLHTTFWNGEDHRIRFQFGMPNSEFPNSIAKKEFVLDFDCCTTEPISADKVADCLTSYNSILETLFERSIAAGLRDLMRPE